MNRQEFITKVTNLVNKKKIESLKRKIEKQAEIKQKWEERKKEFEGILETAINGAVEKDQTCYVYELTEEEDGKDMAFEFNKFLKEENLEMHCGVRNQDAIPANKYAVEVKKALIFTFR